MTTRASYVQWQDWREWQRVHASLFSHDLGEQQRALARVAAWRSRAQLPVAISATAQLLEIQLHERMAQQHHHSVGVATRSHMELSLQYASAVVRCVNGLVDGSQKGAYAMAVSSLAQRIGIPLWIVDLRHESTHNQMPSLPVLRFAAQHLLAWLRSNYWFPQEELLRSQVRLVGAALQAKLAQLVGASSPTLNAGGAMTETNTTAPPALTEVLDADKVRNVVVPLLVYGAQYGEQVASTGLLFVTTGASIQAADDDDAYIDAQLAQYPRDAFTVLLFELQSVWRSFGAWLLAHLCRKVFQLNGGHHDDDDDEDEDDETMADGASDAQAALARRLETEICLLWVKRLVANDWREKLKFAVEPIDDLYVAGAEMLCRSEALKPTNMVERQRRDAFERLQAALRSCKGIRTHTLLATDAAVCSTMDALVGDDAASLPTWTALPAWTSCPLGMRSTFGEIDTQLECTLDSIDRLDGPFASSVYAFEPDDTVSTDASDDAAIDAMFSDLDAAYDATLAQALKLKDAVVHEVIREGQSVHQKLLPQDELTRIRNEIEIW